MTVEEIFLAALEKASSDRAGLAGPSGSRTGSHGWVSMRAFDAQHVAAAEMN